MQNLKYSSHQSSSVSSATSNNRSSTNRLKSPEPSDYEYLGRLVTRERPIIRKSNSIHQNIIFPQNKQKYYHSMGSHHQQIYDEASGPSTDDEIDNADGLSKPLGIIRINDRHLREIYRLPTPPPKVKRVYHRLRSPEPKVIERVFVRRPPPQIIENIIEVPPEKVRIITREKYLGKSTPITRSKLVHLNSRHHHTEEEDHQQTFIPSGEYSQQQTAILPQQSCALPQQQYSQQQQQQYPQQQMTTVPSTTPQQATATTLVYPPQSNLRTVGYIQSTVPPHIMFKSQQPLQISAQQLSNNQIIQPTSQPYPIQENALHQMVQPTPYTYPSQQIIPNSPYGYTQY